MLLPNVSAAMLPRPLMGSGTTAIAADRLGRRWFGCDTNPDYVKIALRRIERGREKQGLRIF